VNLGVSSCICFAVCVLSCWALCYVGLAWCSFVFITFVSQWIHSVSCLTYSLHDASSALLLHVATFYEHARCSLVLSMTRSGRKAPRMFSSVQRGLSHVVFLGCSSSLRLT